ncbi:MAG: HYR domain-containing protein [Bacteroidia bacterium]|nr:HYR domain-containing protein [Bacteroidia bacterium]
MSNPVLQAQTVSATFNYTGGVQNWTVPAGVTSITIQAWGAQGRNSSNNDAIGGRGGYATGVRAVTPGTLIRVYVGGGGGTSTAGGWNGGGNAGTSPCTVARGGGGGGASDVRIGGSGLGNRVIVAAGGGGAGGHREAGCGRGTGGGGGGGYYGGGGGAGWPGIPPGGPVPTGGTQSSGGAGGVTTWTSGGPTNGTAGGLGFGGTGGNEVSSSQGGSATPQPGGYGGGLTGQNGLYNSNNNWTGQSGAGGSGYIGGVTSGSTSGNVKTGNGQVVFTYVSCPAINPGSISGGGTICSGGNLGSFGNSASASGGQTPYTYQWQQRVNCSGSWTNISGATGTTYNPPALTTTTCYRRRVIDGCNPAAYTNTLTITVVADPTISASGGTTICVGGSVTLSSSTSGGTGSASYQWQSSPNNSTWTNISGATSSTYNTGALSATTFYRVQRISNGTGCNDPYSNSVTVTVVADPSVSTSGGGTICVGGTRTLTASTSNGTGCSYQWQSSPNNSTWTNIPGATGSTYTTPALSTTTYYRVRRICTGSGCSDPYSNVQTVTVVADPTISASGNTTICSGGTASLSSSTSGGTGCSYQWQSSPNNSTWTSISGATGSTYNTPSLTSTTYYRLVRNCTGSGCSDPTSNVVTITVVADPSITSSGGGTICVGGSLNLSSSASGGTGSCTYEWQSSPNNSTWTTISGATASTYNTGALSATTYYRVIRRCSGTGCNQATSNVQTVTVVPDPTISSSGGGTICSGGSLTLSSSTSGGTGSSSYQWQSSPNNSTWTNISGATASTYNTGVLTTTTYYRVRRISNGSGCNDPYSNVQTVTVVADPSISASGATTICSGGSASLSSSASGGTGSCSFQWQSSPNNSTWTSISGATGSTYATPALTSTTYYRVVRNCTGNGCGTATSNSVAVTVVADPSISASGATTICSGGSASLSSSASGGTGGCSFQWQSSPNNSTWTSISGATGSTYATPALTSTTYYRVVRNCTGNGCGTATSNSVAVTVVADLSISASGATTICSGGSASLSSSASGGTGSCSFQWQSSPNNSTWTSISGATGSTYATPALTSTTYYRVVRNCTGNGCGTATSNSVAVTVVADPSISASGATTICSGGSASLSSSASGGTGSCSFQWQSSPNNSTWTSISGATGSTYATPALTSTTYYRVVRNCTGNGCGSATSNSVAVTVVADPSISASGATTICSGGSASLSSSASGGTGSCSFQWQSSPNNSTWTSISGATGSTYATPGLTSTTYYRVVRNCTGNGCGTATSNSVAVTVVADPSISASGATTICSGGSASLSSSASGGTGSCSFQWQSSPNNSTWTSISGATGSTYATPALTSTTYYRVVRNCTGNGCGSATSNSVAVTVVADPSISASGATTICSGGSASLSSSASGGTGSCSFQWQSSPNNSTWTSISGATGSTYATPALTSTTYYRVVRNCTGNGCGTASSNSVAVTVDQPVTANAGPNQFVCGTTATLSGNSPITGGGIWTVVSGTGTFASATNPGTAVSGLSVGPNTFRWTLANGVCPDSQDDVVITRDNVAPAISCPANITAVATSPAGATVSFTAPAGTDNCPGSTTVQSGGLASGSTFPIGTSTVAYTVTDGSGLTATCSFTITVSGVAPSIVCPGNITVNNDAGQCSAVVNFAATDGVGIPPSTITYSQNPGTSFNVGSATVTATATNAVGSSNCSFMVNVVDNEPPVAHCKNVTIQLNSSGNGSTTTSAVNNNSTDNCGISSLSLSKTSFNCSNVGANAVTLTVTDVHGNSSTCSANVTVQDNVAPVALCQDVTVQLNASGSGSTTASAVNNGSNDACGMASLSLSTTTFGCSNVGANAVTLTVTDNNGNSSACSANVEVEDNVAPVALCQDVTVQLNASGTGSTTASAVNNGSSDACGISSLTLSITTFGCSNVGANAVTLTVTDNNGNSSTCSATVTVQDNIAPVALCQNLTLQLDAQGSASITAQDLDNGSSDACGIASLSISQSTFTCQSVTTNNVVTLTVVDNNGNSSNCTGTVSILDTVPPVAVCQNITIQLDNNGNASITPHDVDGGTNDACGVASLSLGTGQNLFDCSSVGPNTVTLTASDVNGNSSTCTSGVTVEDQIPPLALCQDITVSLDATGNVSIAGGQVDGGSTDNCTIQFITVSPPNTFDCNNIGANVVTLAVVDVNNNYSICTANVTIEDNTPPVAICKDITVQLSSGGTVSIAGQDVDNSSTDACGIQSYVVSPSSFDCSDQGSNPVTLTVTDVNGNSSTCSASVRVEDNVDPIAICQDVTVQLDANGNASTTAQAVDNGSNDACGIVNLSLDVTSFDCSNLGANQVTLTVTDGSTTGGGGGGGGQQLDQSQTTTTTRKATLWQSFTAAVTGQLTQIDLIMHASSTTNTKNLTIYAGAGTGGTQLSGPQTLTFSTNSVFESFTLSTPIPVVAGQVYTISLVGFTSTRISYAAGTNPYAGGEMDVVGGLDDLAFRTYVTTSGGSNGNSPNTATCTATVTVQDNIPPTISCPPTQNLIATSAAGATATFTNPVGSDNCPSTTAQTAGLPSGSTFPIGSTTNTFTVTDASGNTASCSFDINVVGVPPAIVCPADITVNTTSGQCDGVATYTATDPVGIPASTITYTIAPGSTFPLGSTSVTATATNSVGSSSCSFIVTVEDHEAPVALCQDLTIQLSAGTNNGDGAASITATQVDNGSNDACGITSLVLDNTSFDCSNVSTSPNTVTLTVTDVNGNQSTCTAGITVEDNVPPVALCQDLTIQLSAGTNNGDGAASITPQQVNNGSSDNCSVANLALDNTSFDCSDVSTSPNTVTLTVTDVNGNQSTCTAGITVEDNVPPVALCQNLTIQLSAGTNNGDGAVSITPQQVDIGSSDNCSVANLALDNTSFDCSDVSTSPNTVTLTVTDVNGNQSTCTAGITVEDNVPPVAICQDLTIQLSAGTNNGDGAASITPQQMNNGSSDNCSVANLALDNTSFDCSDVSTSPNTVTLTVTDVNGNQSTCTAGITVEDNVPPVAICQDLTIQLSAGTNNGDGAASITPQQVDNGSSDNCTVASLALNNTSFSCADVSTSPNTVTLTVTDVNGNQTTCTAGITVEDNVPPVALCQDLTIQLSAGTNNGDGAASITPQQVDNGSSDNCTVASLALDNTSFDCSDVSTSPNTVTLTVTDVNGNQSTCTAGITVEDNVPPVALCQNLTIQLSAGTNNGDGAASITPQQVDNGSSDNCTVASLALDNTSFSCADVSTSPNTVTLTVTDVNGNQSTCTAGITVEDNVPPVALCQNLTIQLSAGTNNGDGAASITPQQVDNGSSDNCTVASLALDNTSFDCSDVSTSPNTVTLTVTDVNGNQSTCTAGITVEDNVPPVALCQDLTIQLSAGTNNGDGAASITPQQVDNGSSDNCTVANLALDNTSFNCGDVSTSPNTVTLTVTDVNGNQSTCTAGITVEDNVPPVALCKDLTIQLSAGTNNGDGAASITPQQVDNGSSDNCTVASLALDNTSFSCADVSTSPNTVTLTVTDVNGNQSTCTAGITVEDNIAPIALCQDITINTDSTGFVAITPQQIDNGSSDNCTVASLAVNPNTFDCNDKGQNPVVLTVTDVNGNVSTCNATVTVTNDALVCSTSSPTFACGYNISCNGQTDGQATVSVTGGCLPYTYLWTDGQLTSTAINLAAGTYSVTVTDGVGDQTTCTITLTEPAQLVDGFSIPTFACGYNVSCNGASDGSIDYSLSGGCQPYTYSWTGPNGYTFSGQDPQNITAGTYNVTATDQNGCFVTNSFTLTEPAPLAGSTVIPTYACGYNISCNGNSDGSIDYSMTGGCQPYSYSWSGPNGFTATSQDISNLVAGTYNVTTTDANGCSLTQSFTLTQPAVMQITSLVPSVFAGGYNIGCNGGANGKITVNIAGGASCQAYTVTLSGPVSGTQTGGTPRIFTGLTAGTYTVTVTDANGCTDVSTITLTQAPPLSVDAGVDRLVILNTPFLCPTITAIPTGGVAPYSYYWFRLPSPLPFLNGQTMIDCPTTTTTYVVRIKDANSCVAFDTVVVNVIQRNAVGNPDCDTLGFKFCFFETCTDTCIRTGNVIDSLASYTIQGNCLGDCDNCGPCANQGSKVAMPEEDGQGNSAASAEFLTNEPTFEAFPNPFEEKTTLRFTLPKADQVTVLVFDLRGELVGTLFDGQVEANERTEVTFQPENVTEGVYISKLVTGSGAVFYRKLILVR